MGLLPYSWASKLKAAQYFSQTKSSCYNCNSNVQISVLLTQQNFGQEKFKIKYSNSEIMLLYTGVLHGSQGSSRTGSPKFFVGSVLWQDTSEPQPCTGETLERYK